MNRQKTENSIFPQPLTVGGKKANKGSIYQRTNKNFLYLFCVKLGSRWNSTSTLTIKGSQGAMYLLADENFRGFHTLSTSANPLHLTLSISNLLEKPQSMQYSSILQPYYSIFLLFFFKSIPISRSWKF